MEEEQRTKLRDTVNGLRLNRKSYSRVGPLAERLLRTFSEAVFILTRHCSSGLSQSKHYRLGSHLSGYVH
jgi:hypothetical protein